MPLEQTLEMVEHVRGLRREAELPPGTVEVAAVLSEPPTPEATARLEEADFDQ